MSESVQTTYEEATRCPKCNIPGEVRKIIPAPNIRGAKLHTVYCISKLCPWYDTCWMVQINLDGSVPEPKNHLNSPKAYVGFEGHEQMARDLEAALMAQTAAETQGSNAEIRNPRG